MSVSFQGDVVFAKLLHNYRMSNYPCPLFILISPPHISLSSVRLFSTQKKPPHLHDTLILITYI